MKDGDLQVWWIPQVPGTPFIFDVGSVEEGAKILTVLADYDLFQLAQDIKPDYSNSGGLCMWEDGEWTDWRDHATGIDCPIEWAEITEEMNKACLRVLS